jgi:hypothetical protein
MSDGREEREEVKLRIEQEKQQTLEDRNDRDEEDRNDLYGRDEWEPERPDS